MSLSWVPNKVRRSREASVAHRLALETWWYQSRSKIHRCVFTLKDSNRQVERHRFFWQYPHVYFVSNQNQGVFFVSKLSSKLRSYRAEVGYRESVLFSLEKRLETRPNLEKMEGQKFDSFYWQGFSMVVVLLWSEVLGAIQNRENIWSALGEGLKLVAVWKWPPAK